MYRTVIALTTPMIIGTPLYAGGNPIITIENFFRSSTGSACATACTAGGCDSDSSSSNDFFAPGDNVVIELSGADPGCTAGATAITWLQTTSPAPGSEMTFVVEQSAYCYPDASCPVSGTISLTQDAWDQGGSASAQGNTGTMWWVTFTVHDTADITVTGHFDLAGSVTGAADQGNVSGLVRQTIQGPGFVTLDETIETIGFVDNGFDEALGAPQFTLQDAAPGLYLVGGQLDLDGSIDFNSQNTGSATMELSGHNTVTVTVTGQGATDPADLDGDGLVNVNDLIQLIAAWGPCPGCPEDLDGDGFVGVNDLLIMFASWSP